MGEEIGFWVFIPVPALADIPESRRQIVFSCQQCGNCCRSPRKDFSVSLYYGDIVDGGAATGLSPDEFVARFCRPVEETAVFLDHVAFARRIELKREGEACVFLGGNRCAIYSRRPQTCRNSPFVAGLLSNGSNWRSFASRCGGLGKGKTYGAREIAGFLKAEEKAEVRHEREMAENPFFTKFFLPPPPLPVMRRRVVFSVTFGDYFMDLEIPAPQVIET